MTRRVAGALVALLLAAMPALAGDVIERIVARVNGRIILQSDWERELRCGALLAGHPLAQAKASPGEAREALDRLIEHQLLRGEGKLAKATQADGAEVKQKLAEVKTALGVPAEDAQGHAWQAMLAAYGITEAQLAEHLATAIDLERLVEARLRPGTKVDDAEIQEYYTAELLPRLQQAGAAAPPLEQVAPKIRELLTERALNRELDVWLRDLRQDAEIWVEPSLAGATAAGAQGGSR